MLPLLHGLPSMLGEHDVRFCEPLCPRGDGGTSDKGDWAPRCVGSAMSRWLEIRSSMWTAPKAWVRTASRVGSERESTVRVGSNPVAYCRPVLKLGARD
ncbi:hypothetical protein [Kitasatospora sp. NPDC050463]|uniref:hypothetical protein n=1 Tax=Kitasatospora sp. NPDC050463 TaxID=3155786 RepID=UPI0033C1DAAD